MAKLKDIVPVGEKIVVNRFGTERTLRRIPREVAEKILAEREPVEKKWRNERGTPIQSLVNRALVEAVEQVDLKIFKAALADKRSINATVHYGLTPSFRKEHKVDADTILDVVNIKIIDIADGINDIQSPGKEPNQEVVKQLRGQLDTLGLMRDLVLKRGGMMWPALNRVGFGQ